MAYAATFTKWLGASISFSLGLFMRIAISLLFTLCSVLAFRCLNSQTNVWQPSPGHTQMPIWPEEPADAEHAFGIRRTKFPITEWPQLQETWLKTIGMISE